MSEHFIPTMSTDAAIGWFREASPYIKAHRGKTLVIGLPGDMLQSELLPTLIHDLTLLSHLGLRLVLCFGLRAQLDDRLADLSASSEIVGGRRVTDDHALEIIVSEAGQARFDLEARLSMGLPNTPMAGSRLSVTSGNLITAQPFGVHNGVDFRHTGAVREVHSKALNALLDAGHLVLLPPLGFSLTGDVFNVAVNDVACACAIALQADKLLLLVDALPTDSSGKTISEASAQHIAELAESQLPSVLDAAVKACKNGVERVHLLARDDPNSLLRELFSRDGSGTLITQNSWEQVRPASIQDVGGIIELISPLQSDGTLALRSRERLEIDIEHFVVSERDGTIVACAALFIDADQAEIACVATHSLYRGEGRADQLMKHLENRARDAGCVQLRLLSTRTGHWFIERGFHEVSPDELPPARRDSYNRQRNSKIYVKPLER